MPATTGSRLVSRARPSALPAALLRLAAAAVTLNCQAGSGRFPPAGSLANAHRGELAPAEAIRREGGRLAVRDRPGQETPGARAERPAERCCRSSRPGNPGQRPKKWPPQVGQVPVEARAGQRKTLNRTITVCSNRRLWQAPAGRKAPNACFTFPLLPGRLGRSAASPPGGQFPTADRAGKARIDARPFQRAGRRRSGSCFQFERMLQWGHERPAKPSFASLGGLLSPLKD